MVNREKARSELQTLHPVFQMNIANTLQQTRNEYLTSISQVKFPQFFYACNMNTFKYLTKEELDEFLTIDDPNVFVDNAIYYMSIYIKKKETERNRKA